MDIFLFLYRYETSTAFAVDRTVVVALSQQGREVNRVNVTCRPRASVRKLTLQVSITAAQLSLVNHYTEPPAMSQEKSTPMRSCGLYNIRDIQDFSCRVLWWFAALLQILH